MSDVQPPPIDDPAGPEPEPEVAPEAPLAEASPSAVVEPPPAEPGPDAVTDTPTAKPGAVAESVPVAEPEPATEAEPEPVARTEADPLQAARIAALETECAALAAQLVVSERRLDETTALMKRQSGQFETLYREYQELRTADQGQALAPVHRALARLADDLAALGETTPSPADIAYFAGQVTALLEDLGLAAIRPGVGEPFDADLHRAVGTVTTTDRSLELSVATVARSGLRQDDGRVTRFADVVVHRLAETAEPEPEPTREAPAGEPDEAPAGAPLTADAPAAQVPADEPTAAPPSTTPAPGSSTP